MSDVEMVLQRNWEQRRQRQSVLKQSVRLRKRQKLKQRQKQRQKQKQKLKQKQKQKLKQKQKQKLKLRKRQRLRRPLLLRQSLQMKCLHSRSVLRSL